MLDLFGNVFGRSKKGSSSGNVPPSPSPSQRTLPSTDNAEGTDLEKSPTTNVYPTILTNDMLKSPRSPSGKDELGPQFGEASSSQTHTWSSHKMRLQTSSRVATTNPMDNVPFVPTLPLGSSNSACSASSISPDSFRSCYTSIDRISVFLAAPSQSEYNFALEKNVIRESTSPWPTNGYVSTSSN